ncbi:MAG: recombinase family protein [Oscillospiraceae bacterium]|nr:recombinase family protein [Oscillospiraceae bacterium]
METGVYVRVSTEEQVKEGYSIRGQEQKLKDYARIKDWDIYDVYIDEGISGKNITARPEINRLIEDVQNGHVKNVLVFKIDRLTRSTSDLIYLTELFNEHNCAFNSLMESIDTQTASGRMFLKIIGIFAEFERENIAERIILGRERKVNEGYTLCSHTASYGYGRPDGQKVQTIIESEAQVVREIFDWYTKQGVYIHEIARRLNLRGVPTKLGSQWTRGGIKNLLANSNYMGHVRHHFEDEERAYTVEGQHEAIISKEVFEKAQRLLAKSSNISPTKQPMEENYFTGFLICAQCGCKLYSHNIFRTLKDGTRQFLGNYKCGNTKVSVCNAPEMSARKLEQAFQEYIAGIAEFEGDNTIILQEQEQEKQERQALIVTYEEKLRQLEAKGREALDFYVSNVFSVDEYRRVKRRLDEDKQTICAELERLQVEEEEIPDNRLEIAKSFHQNWAGLSCSEKRMFLMQFVERIVVENEKIGTGHCQKKVKIYDVVFKEG